MSDKKPTYEDKLRPHVYDGIQEYDNRLPNWWLWTFYGAVIFTVIYWFTWYDTDMMTGDGDRIDRAMAKIEEIRLSQIGDITNETLWAMSRNPGFVAAGREVYVTHCVACHGIDLTGGIGNNLVDNQWQWGNQPISIYVVVARGSPNPMAGMQAWLGELGAQKVSQVVAYILSYHDEESMAHAETENEPLTL